MRCIIADATVKMYPFIAHPIHNCAIAPPHNTRDMRMRLESLETFIVGTPPPGFGGRYFIFVRLTTACGVTGVGEIYAASFAPQVVCRMAEDMFQRYLEGQSPDRIEHFWRQAHGSGFSHRPDPSVQGVVSGLEMACWDIVGKALDRPVHALLGGLVNESLRTYTYLYPGPDQDAASFYNDATASAEAAAARVAEGFTAVKFDPAGQYTVYDGRMPDLEALDRSERFCREIRVAVGDSADLLFGTHGQFTAAGALRMAQRLEPYDPLWFEEPCPPDMPEEIGKGRGRHDDTGCHGRTPVQQIRVCTGAGTGRRGDSAARSWPCRRHSRGQEDRGDGRNALRADCAASVLRADCCRGEHPACRLYPELPDTRIHRQNGRVPR